MYPAENVEPLTNEESDQLWDQSESWQRACINLGEILTTTILKAK